MLQMMDMLRIHYLFLSAFFFVLVIALFLPLFHDQICKVTLLFKKDIHLKKMLAD